ncbi:MULTISPECIES: RidA family protein [Cupriavidus]|jgi:reactive intermediate/imine deaminase|uniref:RidA family protein n=1 Tax=Cupriavidus sp. KB_39 TaxID=3233036 RepID=UPI003F90C850
MIEYINHASAPLPRGHYSQAVKANGLIFVSGQLPILPGDDLKIPAGLDAQVIQVFDNLKAILLASGSSMQNLASVQIFIADIANWPRVNELYAHILGDGPAPARTVVPCPTIHYGAELEVNAIAVA